MPPNVVASAQLSCSFGATPTSLVVLPMSRVLIEGKPAATIVDAVPLMNIPPFGMCNSPANPVVIAATAAALGVFTPMACVPVTGAWVPGSPTTLIGGKPALAVGSTCACAWGGIVQATVAGSVRTITN